MKKENKEKIVEITLEISAFNKNSDKFQVAIGQILELLVQEKQKWVEELDRAIEMGKISEKFEILLYSIIQFKDEKAQEIIKGKERNK